jgi:alpha-L-fucosidase
LNGKLIDQSHVQSGTPTRRQLEYQDWEMGVFFHFGIRSFYEGHRDWDGKPMPAHGFQPSDLSCDNWIVSAKDAGMRYAVLVCKHHDGFANWPSKHSTYSVAQTPWKGGRGNVVREFIDACRRHGMKVGLYYSPAEWGNPKFEDQRAYNDHFLNQIGELLVDYGAIDILWFDGCGSEEYTYDWPVIISEIRRLQPNVLIFGMGDPDIRWVGNEAGIANLPNWNTVAGSRSVEDIPGGEKPAEPPLWLPPECDCMMRWENWFFEEADVHTVKPVEELIGLYYLSVGRGANLLINIGPDRRGLLPDADREALLAFGNEIRRRFGDPLAGMKDGQVTDTGWEYIAKEPFYLDHVAVHIQTAVSGQLITMYEGRNIGQKAICSFPPVACKKVVVEITDAGHPFKLRRVSLHNTTGLTHQH